MPESKPRKECDLVMEGGITSGVVYPAAIAKLHEEYDFRSIGGTSAGAIAAAATAAAQYRCNGPDVDVSPDPFIDLAALTDELARDGNLVKLFQPSFALRAPFAVFLAGLEASRGPRGGWWRVGCALVKATVRQAAGASAAGAVAGATLVAALVCAVGGRPTPTAWLLGAALAGMGAVAAATTALVRVLLRRVPENDFGISTGHSIDPSTPALTDWLCDVLDRLAGLAEREAPLTFGHLGERDVELRMVTTNLTQRRPEVLPFEHRSWIFNAEELNRFFPKRVIDHLVKHAFASRWVLPEGFHFLPEAPKLPVIVAVRMSLSFPVLVSTIPLYRLDETHLPNRRADAPPLTPRDLVRSVFSDGGICSNFPIHFFDRWFPTRPTFGISLVAAAPEAAADAARVHLPRPNQPERPRSGAMSGLASFLARIVVTAKDHRDTLQRELPSYRERVAQIALRAGEGGLNLDMPPSTIASLRKLGDEAGGRLLAFDFDEHRWVRLRVLLPRLAEEVEALHALLGDDFDAYDLPWTRVDGSPLPYPRPERWREEAQAFLRAMASAAGKLSTTSARSGEPRPPLTLRATPRS